MHPSSAHTVSATLTVAERQRALQLAQTNSARRLGPKRWVPLALFVGAIALLLIAQNAKIRLVPSFSGWIWLLGLLAVYFGAVAIASRLQRRLAADLPSKLQLSVDSEHLTLETENASMHWPWAAVMGCEIVGDMLAVSVRGLMTIAVPLRAFGSPEAIQQFAGEGAFAPQQCEQ